MLLEYAFERFAKKTPVSVMVRATIENVLSPERLDAIFDEYAEEQYAGELMFSTVASLPVPNFGDLNGARPIAEP